MSSQPVSEPEDIKRWTAKRKTAVILDIIKGKVTVVQVARQHDLTVAEVEQWHQAFINGGEERMRSNPRDLAQQFETERKDLHAKIGEQTLQIEVLKKAHRILGKDLPEGIS